MKKTSTAGLVLSATSVLLLSLVGPAASASVSTGQSLHSAASEALASVAHPAEQAVQAPKVPVPPSRPGCYLYASDHWVSRPCLSSTTVLRHNPRPVAVGKFPPGITVAGSTALNASYAFFLPVSSGVSVSDTIFGPGAYSVQDNTNYFRGTNGHVDWVQFVYMNLGLFGGAQTCIWQNDLTVARATHDQKGYLPTACMPVSGQAETVFGFDQHDSPGSPGVLSVETVPIDGPIVASSFTDIFGLQNGRNWFQASGGVLGAGNRSEAVFSSGSQVSEAVGAYDCDTALTPGCNQGPLPSGTKEFASSVTGESSNLSSPAPPTFTWRTGHHSAVVHYIGVAP